MKIFWLVLSLSGAFFLAVPQSNCFIIHSLDGSQFWKSLSSFKSTIKAPNSVDLPFNYVSSFKSSFLQFFSSFYNILRLVSNYLSSSIDSFHKFNGFSIVRNKDTHTPTVFPLFRLSGGYQSQHDVNFQNEYAHISKERYSHHANKSSFHSISSGLNDNDEYMSRYWGKSKFQVLDTDGNRAPDYLLKTSKIVGQSLRNSPPAQIRPKAQFPEPPHPLPSQSKRTDTNHISSFQHHHQLNHHQTQPSQQAHLQTNQHQNTIRKIEHAPVVREAIRRNENHFGSSSPSLPEIQNPIAAPENTARHILDDSAHSPSRTDDVAPLPIPSDNVTPSATATISVVASEASSRELSYELEYSPSSEPREPITVHPSASSPPAYSGTAAHERTESKVEGFKALETGQGMGGGRVESRYERAGHDRGVGAGVGVSESPQAADDLDGEDPHPLCEAHVAGIEHSSDLTPRLSPDEAEGGQKKLVMDGRVFVHGEGEQVVKDGGEGDRIGEVQSRGEGSLASPLTGASCCAAVQPFAPCKASVAPPAAPSASTLDLTGADPLPAAGGVGQDIDRCNRLEDHEYPCPSSSEYDHETGSRPSVLPPSELTPAHSLERGQQSPADQLAPDGSHDAAVKPNSPPASVASMPTAGLYVNPLAEDSFITNPHKLTNKVQDKDRTIPDTTGDVSQIKPSIHWRPLGLLADSTRTPEELDSIQELRAAIRSYWNDPTLPPWFRSPIHDVELLRFLRARNGRVDLAWEMLQRHAEWRRSRGGSDSLTAEDHSRFARSPLHRELYWAGESLDGCPTIVVRTAIHVPGGCDPDTYLK